MSQTVLTLEERLFAQEEHCEYDFGGSYLSISLLPLTLPTRTHFHTLDSQFKKLKQNSVFINHQKGWANLKPCKNYQSARVFSQSIYLNKLAHTKKENKKPYEYSAKGDSFHYGSFLRFHNSFFQLKTAMMVKTMETLLMIACL